LRYQLFLFHQDIPGDFLLIYFRRIKNQTKKTSWRIYGHLEFEIVRSSPWSFCFWLVFLRYLTFLMVDMPLVMLLLLIFVVDELTIWLMKL